MYSIAPEFHKCKGFIGNFAKVVTVQVTIHGVVALRGRLWKKFPSEPLPREQ